MGSCGLSVRQNGEAEIMSHQIIPAWQRQRLATREVISACKKWLLYREVAQSQPRQPYESIWNKLAASFSTQDTRHQSSPRCPRNVFGWDCPYLQVGHGNAVLHVIAGLLDGFEQVVQRPHVNARLFVGP